ncbi:MAG: hypothetical protein ACRDL3_11020 [Solirubrobacterales bacterium]
MDHDSRPFAEINNHAKPPAPSFELPVVVLAVAAAKVAKHDIRGLDRLRYSVNLTSHLSVAGDHPRPCEPPQNDLAAQRAGFEDDFISVLASDEVHVLGSPRQPRAPRGLPADTIVDVRMCSKP